jgi:hypothetical protein
LLSGPVPQSKFDPVADANLVVDGAQIVPDNRYTDPEFGRDFSVLHSMRDQLNDSSFTSAELPSADQRPRRPDHGHENGSATSRGKDGGCAALENASRFPLSHRFDGCGRLT